MARNRSMGLTVRLLAALVLTSSLILSVVGVAQATGPVGTAAGFEDDDGDLAPLAPINFDWNSFSPTTWTGTQPTRISDKLFSGWTFTGLEDYQATTSDSAFSGGTKQDQDCPSVITAKADNKADLKRIYLAYRTGSNGHVYLTLAWVRIPQNTTSPSAHVAFEFNQGSTSCGAGSDGLVHRTAGDMLIVYDFEGGGTNNPTIGLSRWITSGTCQISSDAAPCWGVQATLAAGTAEAKVNTFGSVTDNIAPSSESLGVNEFGEAGIDLTNAGVFPATPTTCVTFGQAFGVSRTSGNSGTAQMKDLVGPGQVNITNCATVIIRKVTVPSGDTTTSFGYTTNVATLPASTTSPFSLKDGQHNTISNVSPGSYSVTENDPTSLGYALTNLDCSAGDTAAAPTTNVGTRTASFTVAAGETVDCTYTNTQQRGAIRVHKTSIKDGSDLAGAVFSIAGQSKTTDANGLACVDGLAFGQYNVQETGAPSNYAMDDTTVHIVTVDNNAKCSDTPYVGEALSFTDTPLSRITVSFESLAAGNPTSATIQCTGDAAAQPLPEGSPRTLDNLLPGTYTCTVVVDP